MTWPTNKASTVHVDSGTDSIRESREDIKQNIENTNDIIDTFDITNPNDDDVLIYDSSAGQFINSSISNFIGICVIQFDADFENTSTLNSTIYDGGFTLIANTVSGVSISTPDSAGQEYLRFAPGTYHIRTAYSDVSSGGSSGGNIVSTEYTDLSNDTVLFEDRSIATSDSKIYELGEIITFSVTTDVYIRYTSGISQPPFNPSFRHPDLIISKLA